MFLLNCAVGTDERGDIVSLLVSNVLNASGLVSYEAELVEHMSGEQQLLIHQYDNEESAPTCGELIDTCVIPNVGSSAFDRAIQSGFDIVDTASTVVIEVPPNALELQVTAFERFMQEKRVAEGAAQ